jgi:hypothetical protein
MVAAFAEENQLATIVGAKAPGRLLSGSAFKAGFGYTVGLPVAAYLTWKGSLIEGKGVSPSVPIELQAEQLLAGEDTQTQRALEKWCAPCDGYPRQRGVTFIAGLSSFVLAVSRASDHSRGRQTFQ